MKTQTEINAMIDRGEYRAVIEQAVEEGFYGELKVFSAKCVLINIELLKKYYSKCEYEYNIILNTLTEISKNNYIGTGRGSITTEKSLDFICKDYIHNEISDPIYHVIDAALNYHNAEHYVKYFIKLSIDELVNSQLNSAISACKHLNPCIENFYIKGFITKINKDYIHREIENCLNDSIAESKRAQEKLLLDRDLKYNAALKEISRYSSCINITSRTSIFSAIKANPSCKPQVEQYLKEVFE